MQVFVITSSLIRLLESKSLNSIELLTQQNKKKKCLVYKALNIHPSDNLSVRSTPIRHLAVPELNLLIPFYHSMTTKIFLEECSSSFYIERKKLL